MAVLVDSICVLGDISSGSEEELTFLRWSLVLHRWDGCRLDIDGWFALRVQA